MKIMTKKDFEELNRKLIGVESHYLVVILMFKEYVDLMPEGHLKNCMKLHIAWSKDDGGPESLSNIRNEIMDKGVYSKGLRY